MTKKLKELILTGTPNPKQEIFFTSTVHHVAYGGARYGGKSWAMRRKFVLLALNHPGMQLLLLRRTLPELRENHLIPLLSELDGVVRYNSDEKAFLFPNKARLRLGYCDAETDVIQYQGQSYDVVGFEEATNFTESQYNAIKLCNRTSETIKVPFRPRCYYTANPGGVGHSWFKRLFIDRVYRDGEKAEDFVFIPAKIYDNIVVMERNPEYLDLLKSLPEEMRRAYLEGDWDVFAGQYFREWRKGIHVVKPIEIPSWWRRFRSLDYGMDMTACYWWACASDGRHFIYRELYQSDLNLSAAAKKIVFMTPSDETISYTVASPDLWNRRQETGYSGEEIMRRAGLHGLKKANHNRIPGWRAMREFLAPYEDEQGITVAKLQVFDHCINLIRTLPMLQHDENDPEDVADKPHDVTHAGESIRYGCMSRPRAGAEPKSEVTGTYHREELKMLYGYSDRKIDRLKGVKVLGKKRR